jgi:hypothetical protein
MLLGKSLSALSLFIALFGICLNLIIARPYVGAAYCIDAEVVKRKAIWAWIGKILLVLGTTGQLISLFINR